MSSLWCWWSTRGDTLKKFVMNEKNCRNISINEKNRLRSHGNTNEHGKYASFYYILI